MAKVLKKFRPIYPTTLELGSGTANVSVAWQQGDGPTVLAPSATITQLTHRHIPYVTIVFSGVVDTDETMSINGVDVSLSTDGVYTTTIGNASCRITVVQETNVIQIQPISGALQVQRIQTLLRGLAYDNTSSSVTDGDRVFSVAVHGVDRSSAVCTITVDVANIPNIPPVVLLEPLSTTKTVAFADGDGTTVLAPLASVSDANDTTVASLAIALSGFTADDELLKFGNQLIEYTVGVTKTDTCTANGDTVSVAYSSVTDIFTITKHGGGELSKATATALLQSIAYVNDTAPATAGNRTLSITCNDGDDDSAAAILTISVSSSGAPALTYQRKRYCARGQTIRTYTITNTGGSGTFSVSSGTLPTGLSLNTSTGEISGMVDIGATVATGTVTITCTNANGSSSATFDIQVLSTYTSVSSADSFPYYCSTASRLYVLTEDVSADGTAFVMVANSAVLDLNGYEVTYDNDTPVSIINRSFETGTGAAATGWDFTNAPNAARWAGTFLYNEVFDGDYSLKFNNTTVNEYVENTTDITLEANTTYVISAHFEYGGQGTTTNPGVVAYVSLIADGLPTRTISHSATNSRGIQHDEFQFTTGASPETYTLRVGVTGHASATRPYFIDNINVARTKVYGVAIGTQSWAAANWPGVGAPYGLPTNCVVCNGTITQGQGYGTWAHGVHYRTSPLTISDLDITVSGPNSSPIWTTSSNNYNATITKNTLTSNVTTITSRDNAHGAVMFYVQGTIDGNTILNGPITGIKVGNNATVVSHVRNNSVSLKTRYTNAFAISGGISTQIYDNYVNGGTGEYASRGIAPGNGTVTLPSRMFRNIVEVQQLANNQEYQGVPLGGAYGLQGENLSNCEIYENTITAYGVTLAFAMRFTGNATNISVHDNVITVVSSGSGHAAALSCYNFAPTNFTFADNTIITNDGICGDMTSKVLLTEVTLTRCSITAGSLVASPQPFFSEYTTLTSLHTIIKLLDSTFEDSASATFVRNAYTRGAPTYGSNIDTKIAFELWWSTQVTALSSGSPVASASVSIDDATATEVFAGTTNASGAASTTLRESRTSGTAKTMYTDHDVAITSGALSGTGTITATAAQSVNINLV